MKQSVRIYEVPTLDKFDLEVRDAAAFLDSVINSFSKLALAKCSDALMLREKASPSFVPYCLKAMGQCVSRRPISRGRT